VEAGGAQVQSHPELHYETLSQKKKKNERKRAGMYLSEPAKALDLIPQQQS
jgi:hypothetical protein